MTDKMVSKAGLGNNTGKGVIFDLDGTLLDSMGIWQEIDKRFFARRGIEIPADYVSRVASMQTDAIAAYTISRFGLHDSITDIVDEWNEDAQELYATVVKPKPYALDYVKELKRSGAHLAVATSLPLRLRQAALQHTGLASYFDCVCSVDDAHSSGKEEPAIYLYAAHQLCLPKEACTVFEDILVAIKTVRSAGMKIWAVYDESSQQDWEEIKKIADGAISDFSQAPLQL